MTAPAAAPPDTRPRWKQVVFSQDRSARMALIRLLPGVSRPMTVAVVTATLIAAALPVAMTLANGALIGGVPAAVRGGFGSDEGRKLLWITGLAGALFVAQQTFGPVRLALADAFGRRINGRFKERVMRSSLAPAGISHLEDPRVLDLISTARGIDTGTWKPGDAVRGMSGVGTTRLSGVGSAVLLALFNPLLAVLLVVTWVVIMSRLRQELIEMVNVHVNETQEMRRSAYFRDLSLTPLSAKETRIFGLGSWVVDRFRSSALTALREVWKQRRNAWSGVAWSVPLVMVTHLVAFSMVGLAYVQDSIQLGEMAIYAQAIFGILSGFATLGEENLRVEYGAASVPAMLQLEAESAARAASGTQPSTGIPRGEVRFEAVSFRYPGRDQDVFDGLDLTIPAGRSLAIVGENGAGKTTLVKLLARLYDPTVGRITVDGTDLREFEPSGWQRRIGAIFQDFVRYQLPVSDNVGFGAIERLDDLDAMRSAAERAGAADVLAGLPKGWETVLSRSYTDGADLSGGQWQRVALARALFAVAGGAGILVLDEPTANLDVRAEADIYDRFLELTAGLTTIVISHRFSTVRRAEHIVVLEHGRVVEQGSHDELLAAGGRYARMFRMQASRFDDQIEAVP
ncbi:MAG TPA: ABC transporter ATP-binding protein [Actinomycetota bacterium]|nr:ABC transporter ATP-binding protein [Actinomycetota bacterium]